MTKDAAQFHLGQIIYRKINPDEPVQVTGIMFRPTGVMYFCTDKDGDESSSYDCELTTEKNFSIDNN